MKACDEVDAVEGFAGLGFRVRCLVFLHCEAAKGLDGARGSLCFDVVASIPPRCLPSRCFSFIPLGVPGVPRKRVMARLMLHGAHHQATYTLQPSFCLLNNVGVNQ